jgi:hypothetical protein
LAPLNLQLLHIMVDGRTVIRRLMNLKFASYFAFGSLAAPPVQAAELSASSASVSRKVAFSARFFGLQAHGLKGIKSSAYWRDGGVLPRFQNTLSAFAETIVRSKSPEPPDPSRQAGAVSSFLLSVHNSMPDYLRPLFRVLVLVFDASAIPFHGRPFHQLGEDARRRQIQAWRDSKLEVRRRFVEFYGSLALFGLYSELYGQDYLHNAARLDPTAG